MLVITLRAPLAGWSLPLTAVPDEVFARGMAGVGVAIDPVADLLCAPVDGTLVRLPAGAHALAVRGDAGDVLLHVGIDTVRLGGQGFECLLPDGASVSAGQPLLRFDLPAILRGARSAITPVLLPAGSRLGRLVTNAPVAVGDPLLEVELPSARAPSAPAGAACRAVLAVPFDHGLHARPAAQLVQAIGGLDAHVSVLARGRRASARSVSELMCLGVQRGERVTVVASGPHGEQALARLAALLDPVPAARPGAPSVPPPRPADGDVLHGQCANAGLVIGSAAPWRASADSDQVRPAQSIAQELARLKGAIGTVDADLERLAASLRARARGQGSTGVEVLIAHRAMLADPALRTAAEAAIGQGQEAGHAWAGAIDAAIEALGQLHDARLRERAADLRDLCQQVRAALDGKGSGTYRLPERAVIIAEDLLPSQFLSIDPSRLAGLCTVRGGVSSHVALLAAAQGVPMLIAVDERVLGIDAGTPVVLDADAGELLVAPAPAVREQVARRLAALEARRDADAAEALGAAVTLDGQRIEVLCNIGTPADVSLALQGGAAGCGLLRTEFLFLGRTSAPSEQEQFEIYQRIASELGGRPLTIRTLDAGADKPLAYLRGPPEQNPALGLRGLRSVALDPALFATQLRAMLRVRPAGIVRILLPMVTELSELRAARAELERAARDLGAAMPLLGVMVETPSSALQIDALLGEADFASIGTNDLSQYTLAMDRQHPLLGPRLDALHPSVLALIARVAAAGATRGRPVAVCGALASDPVAVPLLLGLGVREVSVAPAQLPRIKGIVRRVELGECQALATRALACTEAPAVRALASVVLAKASAS